MGDGRDGNDDGRDGSDDADDAEPEADSPTRSAADGSGSGSPDSTESGTETVPTDAGTTEPTDQTGGYPERDEAAVSDAFAVLGDETRLRIISVLGDSGGPGSDDTLTFTDLQERVGVGDSGRFSYHLDRLRERFIERTEGGYTLRVPGIYVYQALQAGIYAEPEDVGPAETQLSCGDDCGGTLVVRYTDHRFHLECGQCEDIVVRYPLDPASFGSDLPAELLDAANRRLKRDLFSMDLGFCPYCMGPVRREQAGRSFQLFREDDPGEPAWLLFQWTCIRCGWYIQSRSFTLALVKPMVVGAFADAGINTFEIPDWEPAYEWTETITAEDPVRGVLEMTIHGVTREIYFDGESGLDVLEIQTPE